MERHALKELCHIQALKADHNFEDTMFVALTRRDIWHVLYGLICGSDTSPDLEERSCELLERLAEVLDHQKPEWGGVDGEATA